VSASKLFIIAYPHTLNFGWPTQVLILELPLTHIKVKGALLYDSLELTPLLNFRIYVEILIPHSTISKAMNCQLCEQPLSPVHWPQYEQ